MPEFSKIGIYWILANDPSVLRPFLNARRRRLLIRTVGVESVRSARALITALVAVGLIMTAV